MSQIIPDISHHDPVINWSPVKKNHPFMITKGTEGTNFIDPYLNTFISYCEKYKIPYWIYTFLKKGNELNQAKYLVSVCKKKVGKYFIGYILDIERNNDRSNVAEALSWLNKQGTKTMLYTQYSQYSKYKELIDNRGNNCVWWECRYGKNTGIYNSKYPCHQGVELHQYTDKGIADGIRGKVDLNRLTGEKDLKWFMTPLSQEQEVEPKVSEKEVSKKEEAKKQVNKKESYKDIYPVMPPRGYYQKGDGMTSLTNYPTQLKRMQRLLNWIDDSIKDITVDGQFGQNTENKVKATQKTLGVSVTGKFDQATLKAAKAFKK